MTAASAPQTKQDWIDRIEPLLDESLDEVSERITSAAPIQQWLQEASFEAAREMGDASDLQAQAQAHAWMLDDLEASFPALVDAVDEMTQGCGQLDLNWRPLAPSYSRVYITFDCSFEVDLYLRLPALDAEHARPLISTVRDALPKGTPFPNRPNKATGLIVHEGHGIGVRVFDHVSDAQKRWQSVTLLPQTGDPVEKLSAGDAADQLVRLFAERDA